DQRGRELPAGRWALSVRIRPADLDGAEERGLERGLVLLEVERYALVAHPAGAREDPEPDDQAEQPRVDPDPERHDRARAERATVHAPGGDEGGGERNAHPARG